MHGGDATECAEKTTAAIGPEENNERPADAPAAVPFARGARQRFGRWALRRSGSCLSAGRMYDIFDTIRIHGKYHTRGFLGNQLWDLLTSDVELAGRGVIGAETLVRHFGLSETEAAAWLASLGLREVGPECFSDMLLRIRTKDDAASLFSILGPEAMRKERNRMMRRSSGSSEEKRLCGARARRAPPSRSPPPPPRRPPRPLSIEPPASDMPEAIAHPVTATVVRAPGVGSAMAARSGSRWRGWFACVWGMCPSC